MRHKHHGAERVVEASRPARQSEMNVTPLIDVLLVLVEVIDAAKGAGVERLGVVTPKMKQTR